MTSLASAPPDWAQQARRLYEKHPLLRGVLKTLGTSAGSLIQEGMTEEELDDPAKVQALADECWYRGDLTHLLRPDAQTRLYEYTKEWRETHPPEECDPIVWNCHRGLGKSYLLVLMCLERCLKYPNQEVKYGSPNGTQTQGIVLPILKSLLDKCPEELQPHKQRNRYTFRNPRWDNPKAASTLLLISCKDDAESLRGFRSDMVVLDEAAFIDSLEYVVNHVFMSHFAQRFLPVFVISSTPPKNPSHPYWTVYADEAERESRYICIDIEHNSDFTDADRKALRKAIRSESAWNREALCQKVADVDSLIVPEAGDKEIMRDIVVDSWPRPKWYWPHAGIDLGYQHNSAVLWGYIQWPENQDQQKLLIIEDELVVNYASIGQIAAAIKAKEAALYEDAPYKTSNGLPHIRRYADNDTMELANLNRDHHIQCAPADKWDKEAGLAFLRTKLQQRHIRIHSRCKILIKQLMNGMKTERGKYEWSEDQEIGHCDAIDALIYLNKSINWNANPIPFVAPGGQDYFTRRQVPINQNGTVYVTRDAPIIMRQGVVVS